jgi:DNA helicase MCM8
MHAFDVVSPVGGHYNKAKTVSENLRMNAALLSRFDLIFILLDRPNREMDAFLSEHVMHLHAGRIDTSARKLALSGQSMAHTGVAGSRNSGSIRGFTGLLNDVDPSLPLKERLKPRRGEELDVIPTVLLRKYIGYCRRHIHPRQALTLHSILSFFR